MLFYMNEQRTIIFEMRGPGQPDLASKKLLKLINCNCLLICSIFSVHDSNKGAKGDGRPVQESSKAMGQTFSKS